ncbi:MAG: DinB family protein [Rubricoccaceae bacterium]|nr:DinB family protein [Rubricoccaceae bacterium]
MTPLDLLLDHLDTAYDRKAWHGPTLNGVLRGVDAALASWRPAPDRHTIWELAVHCAYWKYSVRRRLTGAPRGAFPLDGSNWIPRPADGADWRQERRLLGAEHAALRAAVAALDPDDLARTPDGSTHTLAQLIGGVAAHDLYHAGQIQLMKRLAREPSLTPHR